MAANSYQWSDFTPTQIQYLRDEMDKIGLADRIFVDANSFNSLPLAKRQALFVDLAKLNMVSKEIDQLNAEIKLDNALKAAVAPPTQSINPVITAQDDNPTASAAQVTLDAQAATDDASRIQSPASPQQQVNKDGRVVVASSDTAGTNATPAVDVDGITFGTDGALRPYIQTQATPVESAGAIRLRKPPDPTTAGTTNNAATLPEAATPTTRPGIGAPGADAAPTDANATKIEINKIFGEKSKISPQTNILDDYSSYTYTASMYMLSANTYDNIVNTRKVDLGGAQLLFQSGGAAAIEQGAGPPVPGSRNSNFTLDYYIDQIEILTAMSGKGTGSAHSVSTITMTVIEPTGITLIQNLNKAVIDLVGATKAQSTYLAINYLLVIRFYGYDQDGNLVRVGKNNAVVEKFYPLQLNQIKWKIASKAVEYTLELAALPTNIAAGQDRGTIPYGVQFSGISVREALSGAATLVKSAANLEEDRMTILRKEGNDLILAYGGTLPAPPNAIGAPKPNLTVTTGLMEALTQFQRDNSSTDGTKKFIYPDTYKIEFITSVIGDAKLKTSSEQDKSRTAPVVPQTAADKLLQTKQSVNTLSDTVMATAGQQIVQVIETILRNSTYLKDQQLITIDANGKEKLNGKPANALSWFNISMKAVQNSPFDDKRKDYAYDITYRINAYRLGDAFSDYFAPVIYYGAHKQYNYWFTGQNTAIINFEQTLDNLYSYTLSGAASRPAPNFNLNDIIRRTWQTKSDESDNGADGNTNEAAANLAGYLYSPNSWQTVKLTIVGDPAWLIQGDTAFGQLATSTFSSSGEQFSYNAFLPDGTINMDAGQALFELSFNTPSDYDFETGIIKPTGNDTPITQQLIGKNIKNASETYLYAATGTVKSTFKQGNFTQTIEGSGANQFDKKADAEAYINSMTIAAAAREAASPAGIADRINRSNAGEYQDQNDRRGRTGSIFPAPPATPAVAAQPKLPTSFGQVISTQLGTAVGQVNAIFAQTGARLAGTIVTNRLSDTIISANSAPPVNTPEQIVAPTDDAGSSSNTGADNGNNL